MAANGISTLPTKEERQIAKLNLASQNRAKTGRPHTYDITQLPTRYVGNDVVTNENADGLILGRPWAIDRITANIETEDGYNILTEDSKVIKLEG